MGAARYLGFLILLLLALPSPSLQFTHYSDAPGSCKIIGDADVYGIGVRISFYLNYAAAFIALLFDLHEEHRGARRAINAIAIAVFANILISARAGSFANLEWYIVFILILFLPFSVVIPASLRETRDSVGIGTLLVLYSIFCIVQPWLYWSIPRQEYKESCPAKVFAFFVPIDMYNSHWMGFTKASSIIICIGGVIYFLPGGFLMFQGLYAGFTRRSLITGESVDSDSNSDDHHDHHDNDNDNDNYNKDNDYNDEGATHADATSHQGDKESKVTRWQFLCSKLFLGLIGASSIAFIEETIHINDIDLSNSPLTATSQLIPFTVGLFSLLSVVWSAVKQWRKRIIAATHQKSEVQWT